MAQGIPMGFAVRQIVGRCHVGDTYSRVLRYLISRMKNGWDTWYAMPVEDRKQVVRYLVKTHRGNRRLYQNVMGGHI